MKLRVLTHAERDLRGTMPQLWPEFMSRDEVVSGFWPRLYDEYADFQLWVVDGKETIGYASTLPVRWDGLPEPRGLSWAMSRGIEGEPSTLCAVVAGIAPPYRGKGLSSLLLRRMAGLAAAHEAGSKRQVEIQLVAGDGSILFRLPGALTVQQRGLGDAIRMDHVLTLNHVQFERPGRYRFDVLVDGRVAAAVPLQVEEIGVAAH